MQIPSSNSTLCGDSVFISYARADDLKPPFEETTQGWVTFFWHQLRFELINCGAKQAELWLDRYQIEPAEAFTPKIEQALAQASMLIAVFSENWVQSAWCQEEIDWFGKQHADASDRIVPVYKSDLYRELLPVLIRGYQARIGFRFFTSDDAGHFCADRSRLAGGHLKPFYGRSNSAIDSRCDVCGNMFMTPAAFS